MIWYWTKLFTFTWKRWPFAPPNCAFVSFVFGLLYLFLKLMNTNFSFISSAECSLYLCLPDICTLQMLAHQVVVPHYNRCFVFALITISVMMSVLLSLIDPALLCSDFLLFFLLFLLSKHSEDIVVDFIKSVSGSSTNQDLKTKVHWMWPVRNAAPLLMGFFRVPVVNKRGWCTARDVEVSVSNTELQESFQQSGKS